MNKTRQAVAFAPDDYRSLERMLRESFPAIRFLDKKSSFNVADYSAMRRRREIDPKDDTRLLLPRSEWKIRYFEHLLARDGDTVGAWCEPPGWRMRFSGPDEVGNITLLAPHLASLTVHMCYFEDAERRSHWPECPERKSDDDPIYLVPMPLWTNHAPEDAEQRAFARGVWRALNRLMSNRLDRYASADGRYLGPEPKGSLLWAGEAARAWTLQHPKNFIRWGPTIFRAIPDSA